VEDKVKDAVKEALAKVAMELAAWSPSLLAQLWRSSAGTPTAIGRRAPPRR
jgi:hypothetical protein